MRISYLAYTLSLAMLYFSVVLLIPIMVAVIYQEYDSIFPFFIASASILMLGIVIRKIVKKVTNIKSINDIKRSEGLCVVTFSWILAGLFASIPYLFFGINPLNSIFEATSGITATGATIFTHFNYPHSLFFWRSFSQWLGGMGIIILFIAVLPQFAIAGRQMFFAEAPGPTEDKLTPRIKNTASSLWKIYLGVTILEIILLRINGMSGFHAVCNSFSCVSGGGLSPNADSLIGSSVPIIWIMTIFMFFAGASYNLQFQAWTKFNPKILFRNEEFKTYFKIVAFLCVALVFSLCINSNYSIIDGINHSCFQVSSVISTSGFCSVNFASWDYLSKAILLVAMLVGSCSSSAGGGIKIMRWLLILKIMQTELVKILHPHAVFNIKIGKYSVSKEVLNQILMFVFFYIIILVTSGFLIAIIEQDTVLGISSAISSVGNIGPGLTQLIGPIGSYNDLHSFSKIVIIIDMYIGRLELIPFLVLFQKDLWNFKV